MCKSFTNDDRSRILGFGLFSNIELTEAKVEPILDSLIDAVVEVMGPNFIMAPYTIEAGVYDWGDGLTDIRVWRVFST